MLESGDILSISDAEDEDEDEVVDALEQLVFVLSSRIWSIAELLRTGRLSK